MLIPHLQQALNVSGKFRTTKTVMRQLTYILTIILFASCEHGNEKGSDNPSAVLPIDTLVADNYVLSFESADSFPTTDIYGDLAYRNTLTDTIDNWGKKAVVIQSYLLNKSDQHFYVTDSTLVLMLANGTSRTFSNKDEDNGDYKHYYFEHYFDKIDYYLISVHLYEGGYWILLNRKNGFSKIMCGLPYISNNNRTIVCINSDLEAGYTFNGLELFSILHDSLYTEFRKETKWGPTDIKWINENLFLIKREHFHADSITGIQNNIIDYKRVTIEKKTSR